MITISKIANAGAALGYYAEKDDYYLEGGGAPAAFVGRGSAELKLSGAMTSHRDARAFANVMTRGGGNSGRHTPGWDVTFSAPKSVSVAALVGGDHSLITAHERAVVRALEHIEQHAIVTRQRGSDGQAYEWRHGVGMVAATFRHATSRDQDPQLHTHTVIANMTRDRATGEWRALDSRELYRIQSEADAIYVTELASEARRLGYAVELRIDAKGHPQLELGDVPQAIREHFSARSQQIEARLAGRGLTRETASPDQKQEAALKTRAKKEQVDHAALRERWCDQARAAGYEPTQRPLPLPADRDPMKVAAAAVRQAAEHLGEREARFSARALEHEARLFAEGRADGEQICAAIGELATRGELEHRDVLTRAAGGRRESATGFTTRAGIVTESKMLLGAHKLRDRTAYIGPTVATSGHRQREAAAAIRAQEIAIGREFTTEQRVATTAILTTGQSIHILHGHAGTAKTSSVLAALRNAAEAHGYTVRALAPTNDAAQKLGDSIKATPATVASHLLRECKSEMGGGAKTKPALWIVDEAGLVSAKDMQRLLEKAESEHATVVLAGDTKQLGSVEAGAAFEQLRDRFGSVDLTDIKRQRNEVLRSAVYDAERGDVRSALAKVPVVEAKTREARVEEITRLYMTRTVEQRKDTLVLAPGKDDREQINIAIREARQQRSELGRETTVESLQKADMTRAERKQAARYQPGMIIEAGRGFQRGPDKGNRGEVVCVEKGKVVVVFDGGHEWRFDPRKTTSIAVYEGHRALRVAEGDRLVAKATIHAHEGLSGKAMEIKNGTQLDVVRVRDDAIIVRDHVGTELAIGREVQVDHAYAQTVHQAQGQDYAHVIAQAESKRENLASLSSLYVTISRARESAVVVSDSKEKLVETLERNTGRKVSAIERQHEQMQTAPYQLGQLAEHQRAQQQPASIDRAQPEPQVLQQPKQPPSPERDQDRDDGPSWV